MGYRYHNERINSVNDVSVSCKKFVNFSPVSPELTELICERLVRHGEKTGVFSRISPDILDRVSQSFHHMKDFGGANDGSLRHFPICFVAMATK